MDLDLDDSSNGSDSGNDSGGDDNLVNSYNVVLSRRRFVSLLRNLSADQDEFKVKSTLHDLSNYLLMVNEDGLVNFKMERLIKEFIRILNSYGDPEILMLVLRAVFNLLDSKNSISKLCVDNGLVPMLLSLLQSIEYMDVAESALQVVERLSITFPSSLFNENGLTAVLQYIDFFPLAQQRQATMAAANMCFKMGSTEDAFKKMEGNLDILGNLLTHGDSQVMENTLQCFTRIVDEFIHQKDKLRVIVKNGLIEKLIMLIAEPKATGNKIIYATRMLTQLGRGNHEFVIQMINIRAHEIALNHIFGFQEVTTTKPEAGAEAGADSSTRNTLEKKLRTPPTRQRRSSSRSRYSIPSISPRMNEMLQKSSNDLLEVTYFVSVLLPALPVDILPFNTVSLILSQGETRRRSMWVRASNADDEALKLKTYYENNRPLLDSLISKILPQMVILARTANHKEIIYGGLLALCKTVRMLTPGTIEDFIRPSSLVDLITHILFAYKGELLVESVAVLFVKFLCNLDPDVFVEAFRKEGIHYQLKEIGKKAAVLGNDRTAMRLEDTLKTVLDIPGLIPSYRRASILESVAKLLEAENRDLVAEGEVREWLSHVVKDIWSEHFEIHTSGGSPPTNELETRMSEIVAQLRREIEQGVHADIPLDSFAEVLMSTTAYGLRESGLLTTLTKYMRTTTNAADLALRTSTIVALLGKEVEFEGVWGGLSFDLRNLLEVLILRINQSLEKTENFHHFSSEKEFGSFRMLFNPFKVHLGKLGGPLSTDSIYIDPLALVSNLEGFVRDKVDSGDVEMSVNGDSDGDEDMEGTEDEDEDDSMGEVQVENTGEVEVNDGEEDGIGGTSDVIDVVLTPSSNATKRIKPKSKSGKYWLLYLNGVQLNYENTFIKEVRRILGDTNLLSLKDLWRKELNLQFTKYVAEQDLFLENEDLNGLESVDQFTYMAKFKRQDLLNSANSAADKARREEALDLLELLRTIWYIYARSSEGQHTIGAEMGDANGYDDIFERYQLFINPQINSKMRKQLLDPVMVASGNALDDFRLLADQAIFLFSRDVRELLFATTSFGLGKALHAVDRNLRNTRASNTDYRITRIPRTKVRVERSRMLESGIAMRKIPKIEYGILEVQYFNEKGIGLGPTLEFFNEVGNSIQETKIGLWWNEDGNKYVHTQHGLFPLPLAANRERKSVLQYFKFLGFLTAKALKDSRLIDIHFSIPFFKRILGEAVTFEDIRYIDQASYAHLVKIKRIVENYNHLNEMPAADLTYDGVALADLALAFTLPRNDDIELIEGGKDQIVTLENAQHYLERCCALILGEGVDEIFGKFMKEFEAIIPISRLRYFDIYELDTLISGEFKKLTRDDLIANIKCDHGYAIHDRTVQNLVEVVASFTEQQQKALLQFVTGCPRMRIGGLSELDPPFTIVKKVLSQGTADEYAPSVSTCTNYFKIPDYSNIDILREKLLLAITEGQQNFSLT